MPSLLVAAFAACSVATVDHVESVDDIEGIEGVDGVGAVDGDNDGVAGRPPGGGTGVLVGEVWADNPVTPVVMPKELPVLLDARQVSLTTISVTAEAVEPGGAPETETKRQGRFDLSPSHSQFSLILPLM